MFIIFICLDREYCWWIRMGYFCKWFL